MNKFSRVLAVAGITGALAVGGAGVAQASTDHGLQSSRDRSQQAQRHDKSNSRHDKNSRHDHNSRGRR